MDKNKTSYKLLTLLADGRFHSGQELGRLLGITRSGVWKALQQLEQVGIELHAVTGKGYRLPQCLELLDNHLIQAYLHSDNAQHLNELILLSSIDSTNEHVLALVKQKPRRNIACFAEHQTAGRGTSGRHWVSSFATNLSLSLLWHFHKDPSEIMGLSLAIGVTVVKALIACGIPKDIQLKWPNDILWRGKKLAGILIDLVAEPHSQCSVVIGVGLNINIPTKVGENILQPWTHLAEIIQPTPKRNQLAGILLNELLQTVQIFEKKGLAPFLQVWKNHDCMQGNPVTVITPQSKLNGIMQGISEKGELIIQTEQNKMQRFISGEVSLRLAESVA